MLYLPSLGAAYGLNLERLRTLPHGVGNGAADSLVVGRLGLRFGVHHDLFDFAGLAHDSDLPAEGFR